MPAVIVVTCAALLGIHGLRELISNESRQWRSWRSWPSSRRGSRWRFFPKSVALVDSYQAIVAQNPIFAQQIGYLMGDGQLQALDAADLRPAPR